MKAVKAILGTGVYFYAATILFQYGYNSYFGIPLNFIEPSIRDNIIFFFDLSKTVPDIAINLPVLIWILLIITALVFWFLISFYIIRGVIKTLLVVSFILFTLYGFNSFGNRLAESTTEFRVISSSCLSQQENFTYIIPAFYQTTALITPIDSNNKLTGKFMTKQTTELPCEVEKKVIGKVYR